VAFSDGPSIIDGCSSQPIVFGYALCFTSIAAPGEHTVTGTYLGDNAHAPSSVSAPVGVGAHADPSQVVIGQLINAARILLAVLVPGFHLPFGF